MTPEQNSAFPDTNGPKPINRDEFGRVLAIPSNHADFTNADVLGRVRLNCIATIRDHGQFGLRLANGLQVTVQDEELEADVVYSDDEKI